MVMFAIASTWWSTVIPVMVVVMPVLMEWRLSCKTRTRNHSEISTDAIGMVAIATATATANCHCHCHCSFVCSHCQLRCVDLPPIAMCGSSVCRRVVDWELPMCSVWTSMAILIAQKALNLFAQPWGDPLRRRPCLLNRPSAYSKGSTLSRV